jgi:hypothetical protein
MMVWLAPKLVTIPPEIRALPAVVWRGEDRGGPKLTKIPFQIANTRRKAAVDRCWTWGCLDDAFEAYSHADLRLDGIGTVLTARARISCYDLDGVIGADGQLDVHAATIVERCDSFTEISPSGRGLHIFVRGTIARTLKAPQIASARRCLKCYFAIWIEGDCMKVTRVDITPTRLLDALERAQAALAHGDQQTARLSLHYAVERLQAARQGQDVALDVAARTADVPAPRIVQPHGEGVEE